MLRETISTKITDSDTLIPNFWLPLIYIFMYNNVDMYNNIYISWWVYFVLHQPLTAALAKLLSLLSSKSSWFARSVSVSPKYINAILIIIIAWLLTHTIFWWKRLMELLLQKCYSLFLEILTSKQILQASLFSFSLRIEGKIPSKVSFKNTITARGWNLSQWFL